MKKNLTQRNPPAEESHQLKTRRGSYQSYLLNMYKSEENIPYPIGHGWCLTNAQSVFCSESAFFKISLICVSLQLPLVLSLFIFKVFWILILFIYVSVRHIQPPLPAEVKQMTETPADMTTDEKRYSCSEESDKSPVCNNDSDFNDTGSFDKEVQRLILFSLMLVCF